MPSRIDWRMTLPSDQCHLNHVRNAEQELVLYGAVMINCALFISMLLAFFFYRQGFLYQYCVPCCWRARAWRWNNISFFDSYERGMNYFLNPVQHRFSHNPNDGEGEMI